MKGCIFTTKYQKGRIYRFSTLFPCLQKLLLLALSQESSRYFYSTKAESTYWTSKATKLPAPLYWSPIPIPTFFTQLHQTAPLEYGIYTITSKSTCFSWISWSDPSNSSPILYSFSPLMNSSRRAIFAKLIHRFWIL